MSVIQATTVEVCWTVVAAMGLASNLYALYQVYLDHRALAGRNGYRRRIVRWHTVSESIKIAVQLLFLFAGVVVLLWPNRPDADALVLVAGHLVPARLSGQLIGLSLMAASVLLVLHSVLGALYRTSLDRVIQSDMAHLAVAGLVLVPGGKRSYDPKPDGSPKTEVDPGYGVDHGP